jgi:thioesterase domain-containing protein
MGEYIEFLGLIEPSNPNISESINTLNKVTEAETILRWASSSASNEIMQQLQILADRSDVEAMLALCFTEQIVPKHISEKTVKRHLAVSYGIFKAAETYKAPKISIPVRLFLSNGSSENPAEIDDGDQRVTDLTHCWNKLVNNEVIVEPIEGTHTTCMRDPNIEVLGTKITHALLNNKVGYM